MADPIRTLLSQTSYNADGVTTVWNFSFAGGYLDRTHVRVQVLNKTTGVITQRPITNANFVGDYQLSLTPAIAAGQELTIYRDTPKDLPLVDFADKGALTEASLDLNAKQAIFVAAESSDQLNVAIDSVSQIVDYVESARLYSESAFTSASGAAGSASTAAGSVTAAATQAGLATTNGAAQVALAAAQVVLAAAEKTASAASAVLASQWATQLATPVSGGEYSAKYHAIAAAASAASIAGGPVASVAGLTGIVTAGGLKSAIALDQVNNTTDLLKPLSTASLARLGSVGQTPMRNLLINAANQVNQRGYVSGTAVAGAGTFTIDRWKVLVAGQALVYAGNLLTAPAGGIAQVIEAVSINGGVYTLNWVGTATATVNGTAIAKGAQTPAITAATNVVVAFLNGTVSNPQFEEGTVATVFEKRTAGQELLLCYRFCQRHNYSGSGLPVACGSQYTTTAAQAYASLSFPLRAIGTVTSSQYTFAGLGGVSAYNMGVASLAMSNEWSWYLTFNATATAGQGDAVLVRTAASQWIQFEAEL